jgi:hypothetical protein
MDLLYSEQTCSMAELVGIWAESSEEFKEALQNCINAADADNRKLIVANMFGDARKRWGKAFRAAGFKPVGKYYGNSMQWVYTWARGLQTLRARRAK